MNEIEMYKTHGNYLKKKRALSILISFDERSTTEKYINMTL